MTLTEYDRNRYDRQMLLTNWGEAGQARLKSAKVFIAGTGGLGSVVSLYLAAAGVGNIRICDRDKVELSNLNRQILHNDAVVGTSKAQSAEKTLKAQNPSIEIVAIENTIDAKTVSAIADHPDIVIDCLDNFETRYVLNEYCCKNGIPMIHGAVWGLSGQVTFLHPPETPCLKCIFPRTAPKSKVPVVGATAGVIGSIQALEALKYLAGIGPALAGKMLVFDGSEMGMQSLKLERRKGCAVCGPLSKPKDTNNI
jgi:adenylyltransferase/sulfurtransferase